MLNTADKKSLRQIAHHLDPVVTISDRGLVESVVAEVERALKDHELIKVRIHSADRNERDDIATALQHTLEAELVQRIGKIVVLFRHNPKANARLSNVQRYT